MVGLDTMTKRDLDMEFCDVFDPLGASVVSVELHELTDRKLKL